MLVRRMSVRVIMCVCYCVSVLLCVCSRLRSTAVMQIVLSLHLLQDG